MEAEMNDEAFGAEGLVKRFKKATALDGVDLAAPPGTVLGVLGPNGAGKSTAIRILATLTDPDEGSAHVGGFDVVRHPAEVRRRIGLTGQYATVDEELTGRANLARIGRLLDLSKGAALSRSTELLARFGLADAGNRPVSTYSGGMRRRLDLAASLIGTPAVVFLDEPSVGLDPGKREDLWHTIRGIVREGATVLLTTQYLEEADALADAISVIDHGKVIAHGTPAELKRRTGDRKSTRLNSSHVAISYAVFCLKKKKNKKHNGQSGLHLQLQNNSSHMLDLSLISYLPSHTS